MDTLIIKLGISLAIGLLVGLERGWRERDMPAGSRTAGIRTYGISGLLGGIMASVADALESPAVFYAGFLGFAAVFTWYQLREAARENSFSVTAVIAALCVFGLGGLAIAGDERAAAAGGAALAAILASRGILHGLLKKLSWVELRSAILLAAMTAIGLPLLPNHTIDPWGGVNPFEIWLFTVLTAAISYVGYVAVKALGPGRGLILSSLAGAVVSSTAVTAAFARRAKAGGPSRPLAGGACLAAMVSITRVMLLTLVVKPDVLGALAVPAFAAAATYGLAGAVILYRVATTDTGEPQHGNPFDLVPLLVFAASFAVVAAISAALIHFYGSASVILTSAFSGIVDVDIATLTALRVAGTTATRDIVAAAILAAAAANAVTRVSIALGMGTQRYFLPIAAATVLAAAAGLTTFLFVPTL